MFRLNIWLLGFSLCVLAAALSAQPPRSLGDLTGQWWLALDARIWQRQTGTKLSFHSFEKYSGNPVLRADKPWEGRMPYVYGTILPAEDGKGLRMWYHAHVEDKKLLAGNHRYTNLYATSRDGFHWTKPELGLYPFPYSTANNIILNRPDNPGSSHSPNVIHTPWETDPNRRYKMVTYVYYDGYYGSTSADGIHWTDLSHRQILEDPGDVGNFIWDPRRPAYLGYPKIFDQIRGFRRRCVGFTETREFERWPKSRLILAPDEEDDRGYLTPEGHTDFYGLSAFPYQTIYAGFLWIYRIENGDERIWPEFVYSADGVHWARVPAPRQAVLPLGADGTWDDGMIFTPNQPLVRDGRIQIYYGGFNGPHNDNNRDGAIGLATLRRDGFASLDAVGAQASATTVLFTGGAGELRVNANARGGEIRIELLDADNRPITGYSRADSTPITTDQLERTVKWKSGTALPGSPFRICFWMKDAALYSFHIGSAATHSNMIAPIAAP